MTDGELWKIQRSFVVKHLKLLGLGKKRVDEIIYDEYQHTTRQLTEATESLTPAPYMQSAAMNVLWNLTAGSKFDDPNLLKLMSKRSTAFDIVGGLLNQIPWIRYLAPDKSGYSLIMHINQQIYSMISVRSYLRC